MRPFAPVPWTPARSTPTSRANRRIAGPAAIFEEPLVTTGAFGGAEATGVGAAGAGAGWAGGGVGAAGGSGAGCAAAGGAGVAGAAGGGVAGAALPAEASTSRTASPTAIVSPSAQPIFVIFPPTSDDTNMVALSVSNSITSCPAVIVSPTETRISRTSPDSTPSPSLGSLNSAIF